MAAPTIPPIRLELIGIGPTVGNQPRPASRRLTDRYVATASTDRSTNHSGTTPAWAAVNRAAVNRVAVPALVPVPGAGPVPLRRPRGSTGMLEGLPGQRISSSASFAA